MESYLYFLTFPTTATGSSGKGVRPFANFVPLWLRAATVIGPYLPADFLAAFLALLFESPAAPSPALRLLPMSVLAAW